MTGRDLFERKTAGHDPSAPPGVSDLAGFTKESGGDLNGKTGEGFYWYESEGRGFSDWSMPLPSGLVFGLKHSKNQSSKKFRWNGNSYDPADPSIKPPPGFKRQVGGDLNGGSGEGFYWYETE